MQPSRRLHDGPQFNVLIREDDVSQLHPLCAECQTRRQLLPFLKSLVWLDPGLIPGLPLVRRTLLPLGHHVGFVYMRWYGYGEISFQLDKALARSCSIISKNCCKFDWLENVILNEMNCIMFMDGMHSRRQKHCWKQIWEQRINSMLDWLGRWMNEKGAWV